MINTTVTTHHQAELTKEQAIDVTLELFSTLFNYQKDYFIKEDKVVKEFEYYTPRGKDWEIQIVRKATELDFNLDNIIKHLSKLK